MCKCILKNILKQRGKNITDKTRKGTIITRVADTLVPIENRFDELCYIYINIVCLYTFCDFAVYMYDQINNGIKNKVIQKIVILRELNGESSNLSGRSH